MKWALLAIAIVACGPARESFEPTHLPKELGLAALAAVLVWRRRGGIDRLDAAALGLAALAGISALASTSPSLSWRPWVQLAAATAVFVAMRGVPDRAQAFEAIGWAAAAVAGLTLVEAWTGLWHSLPGRGPASVMGQRNAMAYALVLMLPAVLTLNRRWLWLVVAMAAAVTLSRSRGAWLSGGATVAVWVMLARRPVVIAAVSDGELLAAVVPSTLAWTSDQPLVESARHVADPDSSSGAWRLAQASQALGLVRAYPLLGVGPGQWRTEVEPMSEGRFLTSDLLAAAVERGVPAALLLLGLAAAIAWRARADPATVAVLAGACVAGLFDAVTQLPAPALVVAATVAPTSGVPLRLFSARAWQTAAAALAAAAVLLTSALVSRLGSTAPDAGFADLERALAADPTDVWARVTLAEAYVSAGRCDEALPHLARARSTLPHEPRLTVWSEACRAPR